MRDARRRAALRLGLLATLVVAAYLSLALSGPLSTHRVRSLVGAPGGWAPVVFVAVSAALTVACFPGPLLAGASGLLFGTAEGAPLSLLSATLGATMAFALARWLAGAAVARLGGRRLAALREWVGQRDFLSVLYARIAPGVPYSLVNYAAGLSSVRLRAFVAATALGAAPRAFAYTALGGHLDRLDRPQALIAVGVLVLMAFGGLALARRERDLQRRRSSAAAAAEPTTAAAAAAAGGVE